MAQVGWKILKQFCSYSNKEIEVIIRLQFILKKKVRLILNKGLDLSFLKWQEIRITRFFVFYGKHYNFYFPHY